MSLAAALCAAILAVLAARAAWVLWRERRHGRGVEPGAGHSIVVSEYQSGLGGSDRREIPVPRDPQAYARLFVPKHKSKG